METETQQDFATGETDAVRTACANGTETTERSTTNGAPGRGAPLGNKNRFVHGRRMKRCGLTLGGLPKDCAHILKNAHEFRRQLEQAVIDAHGGVDVVTHGKINTACWSQIASAMAARAIGLEADRLTPADRLSHLQAVVKGCLDRDKVVATLGLASVAAADAWSSIDVRPSNALGGQLEAPAGNEPAAANGHDTNTNGTGGTP